MANNMQKSMSMDELNLDEWFGDGNKDSLFDDLDIAEMHSNFGDDFNKNGNDASNIFGTENINFDDPAHEKLTKINGTSPSPSASRKTDYQNSTVTNLPQQPQQQQEHSLQATTFVDADSTSIKDAASSTIKKKEKKKKHKKEKQQKIENLDHNLKTYEQLSSLDYSQGIPNGLEPSFKHNQFEGSLATSKPVKKSKGSKKKKSKKNKIPNNVVDTNVEDEQQIRYTHQAQTYDIPQCAPPSSFQGHPSYTVRTDQHTTIYKHSHVPQSQAPHPRPIENSPSFSKPVAFTQNKLNMMPAEDMKKKSNSDTSCATINKQEILDKDHNISLQKGHPQRVTKKASKRKKEKVGMTAMVSKNVIMENKVQIVDSQISASKKKSTKPSKKKKEKYTNSNTLINSNIDNHQHNHDNVIFSKPIQQQEHNLMFQPHHNLNSNQNIHHENSRESSFIKCYNNDSNGFNVSIQKPSLNYNLLHQPTVNNSSNTNGIYNSNFHPARHVSINNENNDAMKNATSERNAYNIPSMGDKKYQGGSSNQSKNGETRRKDQTQALMKLYHDEKANDTDTKAAHVSNADSSDSPEIKSTGPRNTVGIKDLANMVHTYGQQINGLNHTYMEHKIVDPLLPHDRLDTTNVLAPETTTVTNKKRKTIRKLPTASSSSTTYSSPLQPDVQLQLPKGFESYSITKLITVEKTSKLTQPKQLVILPVKVRVICGGRLREAPSNYGLPSILVAHVRVDQYSNTQKSNGNVCKLKSGIGSNNTLLSTPSNKVASTLSKCSSASDGELGLPLQSNISRTKKRKMRSLPHFSPDQTSSMSAIRNTNDSGENSSLQQLPPFASFLSNMLHSNDNPLNRRMKLSSFINCSLSQKKTEWKSLVNARKKKVQKKWKEINRIRTEIDNYSLRPDATIWKYFEKLGYFADLKDFENDSCNHILKELQVGWQDEDHITKEGEIPSITTQNVKTRKMIEQQPQHLGLYNRLQSLLIPENENSKNSATDEAMSILRQVEDSGNFCDDGSVEFLSSPLHNNVFNGCIDDDTFSGEIDVSELTLDQRSFLQLRALGLVDAPYISSLQPKIIENEGKGDEGDNMNDKNMPSFQSYGYNHHHPDDSISSVLYELQRSLSKKNYQNNSKMVSLEYSVKQHLSDAHLEQKMKDEEIATTAKYSLKRNKELVQGAKS